MKNCKKCKKHHRNCDTCKDNHEDCSHCKMHHSSCKDCKKDEDEHGDKCISCKSVKNNN